MRTETIKVGKLSINGQLRSESFNEDEYTVDVVWSTGARVRRYSLKNGEYIEELSMNPNHIRLDRLNNGAPVLNTHDSWTLQDVIGTVVPRSAKIERGVGIAKVRLSRRPEIAGIVQDIREGIISNISAGYRIHRYEKTEGEDGSLPVFRATDWEPLEISACPINADPDAKIRSDGQSEEYECVVIRRDEETGGPAAHRKEDSNMSQKRKAAEAATGGALESMAALYNLARKANEPDDDFRARLCAAIEAEERAATEGAAALRAAEEARKAAEADERRRLEADKPKEPTASETRSQTAGLTVEDVRRIQDESIAAERKRTDEITAIGRKLNIKDEEVRKAITAGTTVDQFRAHAIDLAATRDDASNTFPHTSQRGMQDEVTVRREMIANALEHRINPAIQLQDGAREWRGMRMLEVVREMERRNGNNVMGMTQHELAHRAFHSTSDFPIIMEQLVNRTMRAAYRVRPQTFRPFCRQVTAMDFRDMYRIQVGEVGDLSKVNEHGEYTRTTLSEGKEKYRIATYGKVIGITRQLLINDDLGVFSNLASKFGNAVARLESKTVWDLIINNVVMMDGHALFSAAHNNIAAGAAVSAISAEAINAGRVVMAKHKDIDGRDILDISPSFLLYPPELSFKVAQIFGTINPNKTDDVVPDYVRSLTQIEEPRLGQASGTAWYLVSNPSEIDTIEFAYLEGNEGPYTETRMGFDVDGMEVKIRLDFGAAPIDFRGFYKNPGA